MKLYPKLKLALLVVTLLFFYSLRAFAQYPGMNKVYSDMGRQDAQQHMDMMMRMNALRGANNVYNEKHSFIVTMLDSSKKEIYSKIYVDTVAKKMFLLYVDQSLKKTDTNRVRKIYPSQTINIARSLIPPGTNAVRQNVVAPRPIYYIGKPSDSCWMFKVISGPINAYSYLSEDGQEFSPSTIVGIQLNNGPIINFTEGNLKQIIGQDDVDALQIVQNGNYLRAIKRYNSDMKKTAKK